MSRTAIGGPNGELRIVDEPLDRMSVAWTKALAANSFLAVRVTQGQVILLLASQIVFMTDPDQSQEQPKGPQR